MLQSEYLMQLTAEIDTAQIIGAAPLGERRILPIVGGEFSGPGLRGQLLGSGADWVLVRKDGAAQLDVRATLRTDDGALILVTYRGLSVIPAEVRQRILSGEELDPTQYYLRITPYFETAAEKYTWLNRLVAVGIGKPGPSRVVYDIYAIK
jgi:hypothetical protein